MTENTKKFKRKTFPVEELQKIFIHGPYVAKYGQRDDRENKLVCDRKYKFIKQEEWVDEGKYSYAEFIFEEVESAKKYSMYINRYGSHFTGYEYDLLEYPEHFDCNLLEVREKEVVTKFGLPFLTMTLTRIIKWFQKNTQEPFIYPGVQAQHLMIDLSQKKSLITS